MIQIIITDAIRSKIIRMYNFILVSIYTNMCYCVMVEIILRLFLNLYPTSSHHFSFSGCGLTVLTNFTIPPSTTTSYVLSAATLMHLGSLLTLHIYPVVSSLLPRLVPLPLPCSLHKKKGKIMWVKSQVPLGLLTHQTYPFLAIYM